MSEHWIESYRQDGFVFLERVLPAELIDAHVDASDRILTARGLSTRPDHAGDPNISLNKALFAVNVDNPEFQPLFLHAGLRRQVAKLLDDEDPVLAGSMTNIWEKAGEPHADTLLLLRDPPERFAVHGAPWRTSTRSVGRSTSSQGHREQFGLRCTTTCLVHTRRFWRP